MRRLPLVLAAFLTIACTDDPIGPNPRPGLHDTGGRRQLTGVVWGKSSTGVDMVAIGQYNGQYTVLVDINDEGLAVGWGYADTPEGIRERAISWQDGVFTDLGTLHGFSRAHQTNNAGVIVGESQDADGRFLPVVWENGVIRVLPPLVADDDFAGGNAQAINERGDIVGNAYGSGSGTQAVLWPATGGIVALGLLPGTNLGWATGVNRDGTVMGQSISYATFTGRPTVWIGGAMSEIVLPPGGVAIGADIATGQMFNDAGDFLAEITTAAFTTGQAIVFRNGAFETLAMLPNARLELSKPYGLNEVGDVVGWAYGPVNPSPVLWSHDGTLTDLGQPGVMPAGFAHGINNTGLIVGQAHGEWAPGVSGGGAVLWRVGGADVTPPTIAYSSHAATYSVDEHVSITCSATDAESGIATDTCAPIDGDAYAFGLGQHTFSATATDIAGNSASASTSFSVSVTFGSLANLTRRFVTSSKAADALVKDLRDAEEARAKGNVRQAEAKLNDYRRGVQAQVGKSTTEEFGSVLAGLSQAL